MLETMTFMLFLTLQPITAPFGYTLVQHTTPTPKVSPTPIVSESEDYMKALDSMVSEFKTKELLGRSA